ncbi:serine/arginine repetitive matrix protein 1 [Megalops cyprinoides]|uniref:serine/arginine repetitive matrix protein 1 n=1 Tax=Megalops cyprinoides TaxID=118141 RepID=UPI001864B1FD|nr:serine/arginine repetitive matrix protein 1 [Megalops cyprinoides]
MAGDCTYNIHSTNDDTFGNKHLLDRKQELAVDSGICETTQDKTHTAALLSSYFEVIDGVLFRKKLERGSINYREVLDRDRQLNAIATFHQKRPGKRHHTLEDTYRFVSDKYWWEGMYFHIRQYVQDCQECQAPQRRQEVPARPCVSKTLTSHGNDVLRKLKGQWEEGLFCDITLKTRGRTFPAHRAVLAAVSEYFQEVFAEMASSSSPQSAIDLTGFSEESFLPLLEFSYTSTLSLKLENLMEISAMARHFRMWAVVEACKAIRMEQGGHGRGGVGTNCLRKEAGAGCGPSAGSVFPEFPDGRRYRSTVTAGTEGLHRKRKREWNSREEDPADESGSLRKRPALSRGHLLDESFKLILELSDESGTDTPSKSPARSLPKRGSPQSAEHPCSPVRRLKLMDFKSPSSKRKTSPRGVSASSAQRPVSPPHRQPVRALRSTPVPARAEPQRQPKAERSPADRGVRGAGTPSVTPSSYSPSCSTKSQRIVPEGSSAKQEQQEQQQQEEDLQSSNTLEKYRLLSVLGLQRKCLLPGPEDLTVRKQKKRLCKLKVSSYSLSSQRKPRAPAATASSRSSGGSSTASSSAASSSAMSSGTASSSTASSSTASSSGGPSCSLGDGKSTTFLDRVIKTEPPEPLSVEEMTVRRGGCLLVPAPPHGRNARSKAAAVPSERRELRRSVRGRDAPLTGLRVLRTRSVETGSRTTIRKSVRVKKEPSTVSIQSLALSTHRQRNHLKMKRGDPLDELTARVSRRAVRGQQYSGSRPVTQTATQQKSGTRGSDSKPIRVQREGRRTPQEETKGSRKAPGVGKRPVGRRNGSGSQVPVRSLQRPIKDEPADPVPVSVPPAPAMGKRQSRPPVKLLDPGFLFHFCRPVGAVKKEEETDVAICLTRSVSCGRSGVPRQGVRGGVREPLRSDRKQLRAKGGASGPPLKRRAAHCVTTRGRGMQDGPRKPALPRAVRVKAKGEVPKKLRGRLPLHSQRAALLESIRRARLKRLRGGRRRAAPLSSHTCLQCSATYRSCEALIMHRIRHVEGKHWPCPLCSKTFFRQRNVRDHIRTHDQKLYKCRVCLSAS